MGLKGHKLRLFGRRYTDHLRLLSRTENRGGLFGWKALETRRAKQKLKIV